MGLIGTDVNSGVARYSFGLPELIDGIGIGTIAMGVFGFPRSSATSSRARSARSSPRA
jgi:TctA family transporter